MTAERKLFWGAVYLALLLIAVTKLVGSCKVVVLVAPDAPPAATAPAYRKANLRSEAAPVTRRSVHVEIPAGGLDPARRVNLR